MHVGISLFAIGAIVFCLCFSPSTAGNRASCQMSKDVYSGVTFISADVIYPEVSGRIPDEDKNFTGSVKAELAILNISNIIGRIPDEDKNFTGSVKDPTIFNITETQLNMSLTEAAMKAEESIENNSHVVDAKLATRNDYIVYELLLVGDNRGKPFTWLIIDPGSGERFAIKMSCECDECKQFAGKWICTGCSCNS